MGGDSPRDGALGPTPGGVAPPTSFPASLTTHVTYHRRQHVRVTVIFVWSSYLRSVCRQFRSSRTAQIYLIAPSLEYIKNDLGARTIYTNIQLRVYYRTVPDMQHPIPTYGRIALPEYLLSHDTTARVDIPIAVTEPSHIDHSRNMWPISGRAYDIELMRQYHRIARIICQRFQTNPNEGGHR